MWEKGQSGNPEGRRFEQILTEQIRIVLKEPQKGKKIKRLRLLAESIVERAIEGSARHAELVLDRIDGKVKQDIGLEPTEGFAELLHALNGNSRGLPPKPNGHDTGNTNGTTKP